MKKAFRSLLSLFIVFLMTVSTSSAMYDPEVLRKNLEKQYCKIFEQGTGTEDDPFIVEDVEDYEFMADVVFKTDYTYEGKYFLLDKDLYFNDITKPTKEWKGYFPLGWDDQAFSGHFDGGGHTIYGFRYLNVDYNEAAGLFGKIKNGSIKNLIISDPYVFGGFVLSDSVYYDNGKTAVAIENCHVVNPRASTQFIKKVNALNGSNITLRNCTVTDSKDEMIEKIISMGESVVTIDGFKRTPKTEIDEEGNTVYYICKKALIGEIGPLVDEEDGVVIIENCVNECWVRDIAMGYSEKDRENYYLDAVGGILGVSFQDEGNAIIRNCTNTGDLAGSGAVGGIAGLFLGKIENCINTGNIYGTEARIGGIVGDHRAGDVVNSVNHGDIEIVNADIMVLTSKVGGIAGINNGVIESSVNYGTIHCAYGSIEIGGIAGRGAYIFNCANFGAVLDGPAAIGGIAGSVAFNVKDAYVDNCYNAGFVEGSPLSSGSVIGTAPSPTKNCYYLAGTHIQGRYSEKEDKAFDHPDFKALTYEEMLKKESFIGFDFENKWIMPSEAGFPIPRGAHFGDVAKPSATKIAVNGKEFSVFCYNINGNNYLKIRDIALLLENTDSEFSVSWDGEKKLISLKKNEKYMSVGSENQELKDYDRAVNAKNEKILADGEDFTIKAYMIDGSNYFVLRDVAKMLGFEVSWNEKEEKVEISA